MFSELKFSKLLELSFSLENSLHEKKISETLFCLLMLEKCCAIMNWYFVFAHQISDI